MDAYSKFIDVHIASSMTSSVTIELMRSFASFDIPDTIVSDNAPNLVSKEIREFYLRNGITLINPSPYHPASNGLAERAVRTFKEGMKKMQSGTLNTKLCRFLYNYRRTIHSVTKKSPAELMFGRQFKSPLDVLKPNKGKLEEESKRVKFSDAQGNENKFFIGQAVFAKNFSPGLTWLPAVVIEVKGVRNYVVRVPRDDGDLYWRRHADHLKVRSNVDGKCQPRLNVDEQIMPSENPVVNDQLPNMLNYDLASHTESKNDVFGGILRETDNECCIDNDTSETVSNNMSHESTASSPCNLNPSVPILRRSARISKPPDRLITTI